MGNSIIDLISSNEDLELVASSPHNNEKYSGEIVVATTQYCEVQHEFHLIPVGKTYYYMVLLKDQKTIITVKSNKKWSAKNALFDKDYTKISGKLGKMDKTLTREFKKQLQLRKIDTSTANIVDNYYIDLDSNNKDIIRLVTGILMMSLAIILLVIHRKRSYYNTDTRSYKVLFVISIILGVIVVVLWGYIIIQSGAISEYNEPGSTLDYDSFGSYR